MIELTNINELFLSYIYHKTAFVLNLSIPTRALEHIGYNHDGDSFNLGRFSCLMHILISMEYDLGKF